MTFFLPRISHYKIPSINIDEKEENVLIAVFKCSFDRSTQRLASPFSRSPRWRVHSQQYFNRASLIKWFLTIFWTVKEAIESEGTRTAHLSRSSASFSLRATILIYCPSLRSDEGVNAYWDRRTSSAIKPLRFPGFCCASKCRPN